MLHRRGVLPQQIDELARVVHLREIFRHRGAPLAVHGARGQRTRDVVLGLASQICLWRVAANPEVGVIWLTLGPSVGSLAQNSKDPPLAPNFLLIFSGSAIASD